MSEIEIITDGGGRRRWSAAEKFRIVEETLLGHDSIFAVARHNGIAPNSLYRWRKLMLEGGGITVSGNESVTGVDSYPSGGAENQFPSLLRYHRRNVRSS